MWTALLNSSRLHDEPQKHHGNKKLISNTYVWFRRKILYKLANGSS